MKKLISILIGIASVVGVQAQDMNVVCVDAGFYCTIAHKGEPGRLY